MTGLPGERRNLRERAAKGVFWTAMTGWGNEFTRLLVFMILSRLLTPADFGLVALALVFIVLTQVVADQGLADALVQRKDLDDEHLDSAFWMNIGIGVALAALLAGLSVPIAVGLGQRDLAPILAVLSLSIPLGSLSVVQRAILTRRMAFRSLALRTLLGIAAGAVLGIAAALNGFGAWSLVVQQLVNPLVGVMVLWRVSHWRPRMRFSRRHFSDVFGFGVNVVAARLLTVLTRRSDELLIGGFLGAASLGAYTVATRMLRLLLQVTSALVDRVAFSLYSRLQDRPARLAGAFYRTTSFAALLAFPAFTASVVMAPQLVPVLFGPQWEASVPLMQILSVLGLIQLLNQMDSTVIKAAGKPSWQLGIIALTVVLRVLAFLVAVRHGLVAVAIAAACVGYLIAPVWHGAVHRLVPITPGRYIANLRGPLVGSLTAAAAMLGVRNAFGGSGGLVMLAAALSAGAVAYVAMARLIARPLVDEALRLVRIAVPGAGRRPALIVNADHPGSSR